MEFMKNVWSLITNYHCMRCNKYTSTTLQSATNLLIFFFSSRLHRFPNWSKWYLQKLQSVGIKSTLTLNPLGWFVPCSWTAGKALACCLIALHCWGFHVTPCHDPLQVCTLPQSGYVSHGMAPAVHVAPQGNITPAL